MASASVPMVAPFAAQRTLQPGMRVRIGTHLVTIRKFLSRGGFAQVYLVEADVPVPIPGHAHPESTLVLKHMCVWNREALATVRAEVEHHVRIVCFLTGSANCVDMNRSCILLRLLQRHWLVTGGKFLF